MSLEITHGLDGELSEQVDRFLKLYKRYVQAIEKRRLLLVTGGAIHFPNLVPDKGDSIMPTYTLARDHADEPYVLGPLTFTDSEGPVDPPASLTESFTSDNDAVVSIDSAASAIHFGTNGGATLSRKATVDGVEFVVATSTFNITPGALIVTGDMSFPGLTPDAEPAP